MRKLTQKGISLLLALVMLLGMLPTTALAKAPSGTIDAYLYYRISGNVPTTKNEVQINDTTMSNYGPSKNNTPMLKVQIDVDKLYRKSQESNSPVDYGEGDGSPEWYFRPRSGASDDVKAFWTVVHDCMTQDSQTALAATGMGNDFIGYLLKRNRFDWNGYNVHMDGILNVSTEEKTNKYICELYDNGTYFGGLVTDEEKDPSEHPTMADVYDIYETHFGMPSDTVWNNGVATHMGYRVTVTQSNKSSAKYKPHDTGDISYQQEDDHYYLAKFDVKREAITYTVTYTDGLAERVVFDDQVKSRLTYGTDTPAFVGRDGKATPKDPEGELLFTGWSPAVASKVTGDVVYTAQWKPAEYTVTWRNHDGTELEVDEKVPNGTTPTYNGAQPTKTGDAQYSYEFIGWSPAVHPVNGVDQEYEAVFKPGLNRYTVIWVNDDNTELEKDEDVEYGTTPAYNGTDTAQLAARKNNAQYTYRFTGWTPEVSDVTGNITYKATYSRSTNTYTVTWIDYNGNNLDTDTVGYGEKPEYDKGVPSRPSTAQYTYTFDGWKNTDGVDTKLYASNGNFPVVTGNVTYQAQYTPVQRNYTVTLKLYRNESLVNSAAVHGTAINPYISKDGGTTLLEGENTATGTYVVEDVPNGTYGIYDAVGNRLCEQIIIVENGDVEKECHYYTVSYSGNGATGGVPTADVYHLGEDVTVQNAPIRSGYTFKGWKDGTTVYQPGDTLTPAITRAYTLVAQWEKNVNVFVSVTIDHKSGAAGGGYDPADTRAEVKLDLVSRVDGSSPYLETGHTLALSATDHDGFVYSLDADTIITTYTPDGATFTDMPGGTTEYTVVASKSGYNTNITATQDGNGDWIINIVMTYRPDSFDLNFTVNVDDSVPAQYIPDAAIVKVTYWDGSEWKIISQHDGGNPGVRVDIHGRTGSGSYPVWEDNGITPYGYRIKVTAFVYPDGTIVPASNVITEDVAWSDGVYTAEMDAVSGGALFGALKGAYYDGSGQNGTLGADVTMKLHKLTFNPNGGTFNADNSTESKTLINQVTVPALDDYAVTRDGGYVFNGWYLDDDDNNTLEAGETTAVNSGYVLTRDTILIARWNDPWTVKGDIMVDATYKLGSETKTIHDADRIKQVTVLLQYAPAGSSVFTTKRAESVTITYQGDAPGTGSYEFAVVPNDGGTWRVHVLNHNYTARYWNENASDFTAETGDLSSPCIAVDASTPADNVAEVDVKMTFNPESFDLWYKVDAEAIGDGFRPTNAEVLVLYDATIASESPREWPVISQMQDGQGGYTGIDETLTNGVCENSYSVWKAHPTGPLYDYAISVEAVKAPGKEYKDLDGNEPFTVEYNGSAEYLASGGYKYQTQLLTAVLKPKSYPVKYYLYKDSTIELHTMKDGDIEVPSHTWSIETTLKDGDSWKDVPARVGYVFTGWVAADGTPVTGIGAEVHEETKLYATWEADNWKDADETPATTDTDSPTGGDGIADSQQVRILYTTDGYGATAPLGEIVTITGGVYTNQSVTGAGSEASPLSGYVYDKWEYIGSSDSGDDASAALSVSGTTLTPAINNADGGKTYTFKASFVTDSWKDDPINGDSPTGGDGIPDKYQAVVVFRSANSTYGTVSGDVYQVTSFADNAAAGTVTPVLDGVIVDAEAGWTFDYWIKNEEPSKLRDTEVEQSIDNVAGGTVIDFYAVFAIDEWKDDPINGDSPTGGDGVPDKYQKPVNFVVVNGSWNDGTKTARTDYVTLMKDGKWDPTGNGSLSAPAVGEKPDSGYKAGSWNIEIPATVTGTDAVTYTYTYETSGSGGGSDSPAAPPDSSATGSVTLTKVDAADPSIKLAKVYFDLYKADGTLVSSYKTGADGTITVQNLPVGAYYWVETRPAAGYMLDNSKRAFTVTRDKTHAMTISNQMTPVPSAFSGEHDLFVVGYPDGTVKPEGYIVRSEVAAIFYRLLSDEMKAKYSTNVNPFPDIEEGMWCETAVSTMAAMGVVCGYPNGNFGPNDRITRAEFATMTARFDAKGNDYGVSFDDIYEHWAMKAINIVANNGWVLGYEDGTFKPNQYISRAEAMTMFNRVLQRVPESEADLLPGMKNWPDNADPAKWYYLSVQEATNSHDYERKPNGYERWTELREDQ